MAGWRDSEYIRFSWLGQSASGLTNRWTVDAVRSGDLLGQVEWYARWRQYVFIPEPGTVFNRGCLHDIADFVAEQNVGQRKGAGNGD